MVALSRIAFTGAAPQRGFHFFRARQYRQRRLVPCVGAGLRFLADGGRPLLDLAGQVQQFRRALVQHTGQRGIVLHISGHDESHDLGGRQHRERFSGVVRHDDSGQAVFGEQAGSGKRIGVGGHYREVFGEFRGTHISDNTFRRGPARSGLLATLCSSDLVVAA